MAEIKIVFNTDDIKSKVPKLYVDGVRKDYLTEIELKWTTANAKSHSGFRFNYQNYEINRKNQAILETHLYSIPKEFRK